MKRLWLLFLGKGAASSLLSGWGQGPLLEDILTYSQRQAERGKGAWRVIPSAHGGVTADTIAGPVGDLPTSSRLASSPARVLGGRGPGGGVRGARWPRPRTPALRPHQTCRFTARSRGGFVSRELTQTRMLRDIVPKRTGRVGVGRTGPALAGFLTKGSAL